MDRKIIGMTIGDVLADKIRRLSGEEKKAKKEVFWIGSEIEKCDICKMKIWSFFVDGKTSHGPWGILCPSCHRIYGVGLGTGRGQKYERQEDGRWLKIEG
jgi:hypothetical protein